MGQPPSRRPDDISAGHFAFFSRIRRAYGISLSPGNFSRTLISKKDRFRRTSKLIALDPDKLSVVPLPWDR